MLFNSLSFALFLPVVLMLYWFLHKSIRKQNFVLLLASYFFYGMWDYRFLFLLAFSTFLDYYAGLKIFNNSSPVVKKIWLFISVAVSLGLLSFFKYYNFFVESFSAMLQLVGLPLQLQTLHFILPIGISFYTFHGLSYIFDIYKGKSIPTRNFVDYSLFVSFFPLLVAGPIERADHLLPQIKSKRSIDADKVKDGLKQILWGLFKKIVIADGCAGYVNTIFDNSENFAGSTLVLGAVLFAFQIYGDFSGYSDIALGTARLFGFELLKNFAYPYFSRDIAEFWRRWHISLSSWFRDYLYIPLGGSKRSTLLNIRNIFIIFLVSGLWHGASWNYILWGALNAIYFLPLLLLNKHRINVDIVAKGKLLPTMSEAIGMLSTFSLVCVAWVFFRAESLQHALKYISSIFTVKLFSVPEVMPVAILLIIPVFITIEWFGRENSYPLEKVDFKYPRFVRLALYELLIFSIFTALFFSAGEKPQFIYFQF